MRRFVRDWRLRAGRGARLAAVLLTLAPLTAVAAENTSETPQLDGWLGMRVIKQEGDPTRMLTADLNGDGRGEIIVINARHSRLDLYHWVPKDQREAAQAADPKRPNELPLAADWKHTELYLDELPVDATSVDLNNDGKRELVMITSPSNKIVSYQQDAEGKFTKSAQWDLLAGSPTGQKELLLIRSLAPDKHELLISMDQGIQTLSLTPGARATWLSPRENRGRFRWGLSDLDGDGDQDLYEWSPAARQTVRWYEARGDKLLPAQVLYDQPVNGMDVLHSGGGPGELLLLGGSQEGLVRRFKLARGEENALGRQDALPMPGGSRNLWTGILMDGKPAIAAVDPSQPRLRVQRLADEGWDTEQSYPIVSGVKAIAAPQGEPGTLLLWVKDAADLLISRWDGERMSYPQPLPQSEDQKDRIILAMGSVGDTTWWAQRVGKNLDVYVWPSSDKEAKRLHFDEAGDKTEKVAWLGGERVLIQAKFAQKGVKLASLVDGDAKITEPAHLASVADPAQYALFVGKDGLRPARQMDGVIQWLDDSLQPKDQTMLGDGQRIASFVPLADGTAWALEEGGAFIHRLEPDEAGILRITKSIRPPTGQALTNDAVLGLMLIDQERVVRLSAGRPWELALADSVDGRVGRASGIKEANVHRILTADITGDGNDEVILCDDERHQLTVLERKDDKMTPVLNWTVFEDRSYPYGGSDGEMQSEPRIVLALDADGDKQQDLAMLCNDRLLIYVAQEEKE